MLEKKPLRNMLLPKSTSLRPSSIFDTSYTYDQAQQEFENKPDREIKPSTVPSVSSPPPSLSGASMKESKSTACIPCSKAHISAISGSLSESIRFAKDGGIQHPEVIDRIGIATDELAAMERIDLAPYKIAALKGDERDFANWIVEQTRNLRHSLDNISNVGDLENTAVEAAGFRDEFLPRFWNLLESVSKGKSN